MVGVADGGVGGGTGARTKLATIFTLWGGVRALGSKSLGQSIFVMVWCWVDTVISMAQIVAGAVSDEARERTGVKDSNWLVMTILVAVHLALVFFFTMDSLHFKSTKTAAASTFHSNWYAPTRWILTWVGVAVSSSLSRPLWRRLVSWRERWVVDLVTKSHRSPIWYVRSNKEFRWYGFAT